MFLGLRNLHLSASQRQGAIVSSQIYKATCRYSDGIFHTSRIHINTSLVCMSDGQRIYPNNVRHLLAASDIHHLEL